MAKRGAPLGNNNGAKGAEWLAALRWALEHYDPDAAIRGAALEKTIKSGRALRAMALKVVCDGVEGKEAAWREVSERLDGKVGTGESGGSVKVILLGEFPERARPVNIIPGEVVREALSSPDG